MGADMVESTNAAILYAQQAAAAAAAAAAVGVEGKPSPLNSLSISSPSGGGGTLNGHYYAKGSGSEPTTSDSPSPDPETGELKTNLIINYLPQNMNQDEVRQLFASMGEIESCKLVRDKVTGQSLGYAFVNYTRQEDAKRAMSSLNGLRLQNKTIKVSFARPSNECIKGANLYVSGLPKQLTLKELVEIFRPYGKIITSRILFDNVTGISKGVGFVRFDKKQEAEYAIEKVHGTVPAGFSEAIAVKFANSPGARDRAVLQQMASNLTTLGALTTPVAQPYAAPLAAAQAALIPLTTAAVLRRNSAGAAATGGAGGPIHHTPQVGRFRYSPLGMPPTSIAVNSLAGTSPTQDLFTTNALLQMAAAGNAQAQLAALAAANVPCSLAPNLGALPQTATSTAAGAGMARSTSPSGGFTIIVANLGGDAEESLLWRLFGPFGAVLSVSVMKDSCSERCRGFALVTMANYEEAVAAINTLNGYPVSGRTIQVSFKSTNPAIH